MSASPPAPDVPLLSMSGVTKRFGSVVALSGVDFEGRRGEVHAICGENVAWFELDEAAPAARSEGA